MRDDKKRMIAAGVARERRVIPRVGRASSATSLDAMQTRLVTVDIFSRLGAAELRAIAEQSLLRSYTAKTILINEGDQSDFLYVMVSGRVKAFLSDTEGREVILGIHGPGEYFGEVGLLDMTIRSANVMTLEPVQLLMIPRAAIAPYLFHADVCVRLMTNLAGRIRNLSNTVRSLALMDVYGRVTRLLLSHAIEEDGHLVTERFTHQEIANRVGASREMVSRIMKDLIRGGHVRLGHKMVICNGRLPSKW